MVIKPICRYELYQWLEGETCFNSVAIFLDEGNSMEPLMLRIEENKGAYILLDNEDETFSRHYSFGLSHKLNNAEWKDVIFRCELSKLAGAIMRPLNNVEDTLDLLAFRIQEAELAIREYCRNT